KHALWSFYFTARGLNHAVLPPETRPIRAEEAGEILLAHEDRNNGARRRRALLEAGGGNLHSPHPPAVRDRVHALAGNMKIHPQVLDGVGTQGANAAADHLMAHAQP